MIWFPKASVRIMRRSSNGSHWKKLLFDMAASVDGTRDSCDGDGVRTRGRLRGSNGSGGRGRSRGGDGGVGGAGGVGGGMHSSDLAGKPFCLESFFRTHFEKAVGILQFPFQAL
jgi:hypothetical protein